MKEDLWINASLYFMKAVIIQHTPQGIMLWFQHVKEASIHIFGGIVQFFGKSSYLVACNRPPSTPGSRLHFS